MYYRYNLHIFRLLNLIIHQPFRLNCISSYSYFYSWIFSSANKDWIMARMLWHVVADIQCVALPWPTTEHLNYLLYSGYVDRSVFRVRLIYLRTVGVGLSPFCSVPHECLSSVEDWSLACGVDVRWGWREMWDEMGDLWERDVSARCGCECGACVEVCFGMFLVTVCALHRPYLSLALSFSLSPFLFLSLSLSPSKKR